MGNWNERMRQVAEGQTKSEVGKKKVKNIHKEEEGRLMVVKGRESEAAMGLIGQLKVVQELQSVNKEVWGNLGQVVQNGSAIVLSYDYQDYDGKVTRYTERKFGHYQKHRYDVTAGEDLSGHTPDPGQLETHFGWHDEIRFNTEKTPTIRRTSLSVSGYYSEKRDYYGLNISDNAVIIPLNHFPEYKSNNLTLEEMRNGDICDYMSWSHYPTFISENGYILFDLDSQERKLHSFVHSRTPQQTGDVTLLFPKRDLDYGRVRNFLLTAIAVSCLNRTKRKKLPIHFQEESRKLGLK